MGQMQQQYPAVAAHRDGEKWARQTGKRRNSMHPN